MSGGISINKYILSTIFIVIASAVFFAGCVGKESATPTATPSPTSTPEQVVSTTTPTPTPTVMFIRIAELTGLEILPQLKKEVYDGNIVIIDVSPVKNNKLLFNSAIDDMKQVVNDVDGDIAMTNEDQLIVTPRGVHIDRQKLK